MGEDKHSFNRIISIFRNKIGLYNVDIGEDDIVNVSYAVAANKFRKKINIEIVDVDVEENEIDDYKYIDKATNNFKIKLLNIL